MEENKISISQVLADLSEGKKASLVYIRSTGKNRGTKKPIPNCIRGWNYQALKKNRPIENILSSNSSTIGKHARKGLMPIIDLSTKQQYTLLISHLVQYNGHTIVH